MRLFIVLLSFVCLLLQPSVSASASPSGDELRLAAMSGDLEALEALIETSQSSRSSLGEILPELVLVIDAPVIETMAALGVPLDARDEQGYSAVMRALEHGRVDNALALFEFGASLSGVANDGHTVRTLAEQIGLKEFGAEQQSVFSFQVRQRDADLLLLKAAEAGDLPTVEFALANGASLSAKAKNGWTALMFAGLARHEDVLEFLFSQNAGTVNLLTYEVSGVDLVTAILASGDNSRHWSAIERMLQMAAIFSDQETSAVLLDKLSDYRKVSENLGQPVDILDGFELALTSLPDEIVHDPQTQDPSAEASTSNDETDTEYLSSIVMAASAALSFSSDRHVHAISESLQAERDPIDAYKKMSEALQRILMMQGCSVSGNGNLELNSRNVDGLWGKNSLAALRMFNRAIAPIGKCDPLIELDPLGSDAERVGNGWLSSASTNFRALNYCLDTALSNLEMPVCNCGSDPRFQERDGRCELRSGEIIPQELSSSTQSTCFPWRGETRCMTPSLKSSDNLFGREFACFRSQSGIQVNYLIARDRVFISSKKSNALDESWSILGGSAKGASLTGLANGIRDIYAKQGELEFGKTYSGINSFMTKPSFLAKRKLTINSANGWICPSAGASIGNCGKEIISAEATDEMLVIGNHFLFSPVRSSGQHFFNVTGRRVQYDPGKGDERNEYWTGYMISAGGQVQGYGLYGANMEPGHKLTDVNALVISPTKSGSPCYLLH